MSSTQDSIGPSRGMYHNQQMGVIGYLVAVPLLLILIPLLPFVVVYWVVSKLVGPSD
jgi:hypothetical protein